MAENEDRRAVEEATEEEPQSIERHEIIVRFVDGHSIDGARIEIVGVTPVQMAAANYYIMRSANQLQDAMELQARMAVEDQAEMRATERIQIARSISDIRKNGRN